MNDNMNVLFETEIDSKTFLLSFINRKNDPKKGLDELKKLLKLAKANIEELLNEMRFKEHEAEIESKRNTNDLVTFEQAALELDVTKKTLQKYLVNLGIKPVRHSKNKTAITRQDLILLKSKK